ncbi:hypothetical protein KGM48_03070 [Patescibacteria group bacterium]|nr:hypothetical protein [Patescibacteria group bacterium]
MTWDTTALLFLAENGYTVIKISTFDYPAFASEGTSYLKKFWRSDVYTTQAKFSNFQRERRIVTRLIKDKRIRLKIRKPTLALVSAYLQEGWLAIAHIDVSILDNTKNYSPHSIVITDVRPTRVSFHDPGLPPEENRSVSRKAFDQALRIGEVILIKKPGALKKHLSHRGT